jgi:nicotinamidase-related amidase
MDAFVRFTRAVVLSVAAGLALLADPSDGQARSHKFGVVVVDLQADFIADAQINPATPAALDITKRILQSTQRNQVPVFVTYEGDNLLGYDMPPALKADLPEWHKPFFKTTYAATGLPAFMTELERSGVTHVVLVGAETDVCVMLTALGLRERGYEVFVTKDAVLSAELDVTAALTRMKIAGVHVVDHTLVKQFLSGKAMPPAAPKSDRLLIRAIKDSAVRSAIVLSVAFDRLDGCNDGAKLERLAELIVFAEWLKIPVYVDGDVDAAWQTLDRSLAFSQAARTVVTRAAWKPLTAFSAQRYKSVTFAGAALPTWDAADAAPYAINTYVLVDASFPPNQGVELAMSSRTAIPISYKSYYRELTGSVSFSDWPSQAWVARAAQFEPVMRDPEALTPIKSTCTPEIGDSHEQEIR